jgi:hypothetical protein
MPTTDLKVGDVVQIDPEHDPVFGGCFLIVSEPKAFGAQGYVHIPGQGDAFYRCPHAAMEYVGRAVFVLPHHDPTAEETNG